MKRFFNLFSVCVLLLGLTGVANAYSIDYTYTASGNQFTSPYAATVETFDGNALLWTWTGSGNVVSGDLLNKYSAPGGIDGTNKDITKYMTVPEPTGANTGAMLVTNLGGSYNYLGLWWGSVDTYNTLTFYNGATEVASITGSSITKSADGNQTAPSSNLYVNFLYLPLFDSFKMASTNFAFEADNIAIARVPEPTTLLLFGLGLIGLAVARRKYKK